MAGRGAASVRPRRWPRRLAILAALLVAAALVVAHYLQPAQLTALILSRASASLHLDLRTSGPGSYALRPEPRLVLPGLSATLPGGKAPFFRSDKVELALPWDTLRGRSADISSIVLKSPEIDLQGLREWQSKQPPSGAPLKLPTLTRGLAVTDGTLRGRDWTISHLDLAVPALADGRPMTMDLGGDLVRASSSSRFALHSDVANLAGAGQGLRLEGLRMALKADGELPSLVATGHILASATLDLDLRGSLQRVPSSWSSLSDSSFARPGDTPFAVVLTHKPAATIAGIPVADPESGWSMQVTLGDPKRQPTLSLRARENGKALVDATVTGQLSRWPDAWPALPSTLGDEAAPLVFEAGYHGPIFPPEPFSFALSRGNTRLQGKAHSRELRAWLRGWPAATLPPMQATLDAPVIDLGGAQLRGVHAEIRDDAPQPPAQTVAPKP